MTLLTKNILITLSIAITLGFTGCQKNEQKISATTQATSQVNGSMQSTASADSTMNHDHMNHQDMPPASSPVSALNPVNAESVYLTNGKWKDQSDRPFDINTLTGQKQVVAFIYTSCQDVCPIMMKTMKELQNKLPADVKSKTGFLVISLDPKRDTPQVLANFGEHYHVDDKWHFLSGSDADIRLLANTMNIRYQFAESGMINHSNVITVLDETGKMIEQAVGNSKGEDQIIAAITNNSKPNMTSTTASTVTTPTK